MVDIYGEADGFVAVGYRIEAPPYAPVIWTSANGFVWLDESPEAARGMMASVVRGPEGAYVAAGLDADGTIQIWRSEGGRDWAVSPLASPSVELDWLPRLRLVASADRLVLLADTALGWRFWTSNDGQSWSVGDPLGTQGGTGPFVAMGGDRVVTFIGRDTGFPEPSTLLVGQIVPAE